MTAAIYWTLQDWGFPDVKHRAMFLFWPGDRFGDLVNLIKANRGLDPYNQWHDCVYFPFTFAVLGVLRPLPEKFVLGLVLALTAGWSCYLAHRYTPSNSRPLLRTMQVLLLGLLPHPMIMALDRANLDGVIFAAVTGAVLLDRSGRFAASLALMACAIAAKGYPALFLLLWIGRGRLGYSAAAVLIAVILNLIAALSLAPGFPGSFFEQARNTRHVLEQYTLGSRGHRFSVSLFIMLKILTLKFWAQAGLEELRTLARAYKILAAALGAAVISSAYFARWRILEWQRFALLSCLLGLLPEVSKDYRLIYLLFPLLSLLSTPEPGRYDRAYLLLFALLFLPKNYFFALSSVINPVLLLLLMSLILWDTLGRRSRAVSP